MHVGTVQYVAGVAKIPCATITSEDAANLEGIYADNRVWEGREKGGRREGEGREKGGRGR
jgi:hypothetical protein